jgi:hypothetical protein
MEERFAQVNHSPIYRSAPARATASRRPMGGADMRIYCEPRSGRGEGGSTPTHRPVTGGSFHRQVGDARVRETCIAVSSTSLAARATCPLIEGRRDDRNFWQLVFPKFLG